MDGMTFGDGDCEKEALHLPHTTPASANLWCMLASSPCLSSHPEPWSQSGLEHLSTLATSRLTLGCGVWEKLNSAHRAEDGPLADSRGGCGDGVNRGPEIHHSVLHGSDTTASANRVALLTAFHRPPNPRAASCRSEGCSGTHLPAEGSASPQGPG